MDCNIYYLTDETNVPRYVGKTIQKLNKRLSDHISVSIKRKTYKDCWIVSKEKKNIKIFLIDICDELVSGEREKYYIKFFKELGYKLTNGTDGGEGTIGFKHSEETRKKMSESTKGQFVSEETNRKKSEKMKLYWLNKKNNNINNG